LTNFQALQYEAEIFEFMRLVRMAGAKTAVEIGTGMCGTAVYLADTMGKGALMVSVDLPLSEGGPPDNFPISAKEAIEKQGSEFVMVRGESADSRTIQAVGGALGDRKVDVLFIDAEHTEKAAMADYLAYKELLSEHGIIAFHDICMPELWPMWNRLRGERPPNRSVEIIDNLMNKVCGIGVLLGNE
jgi:predicted O-methyltransferase YrrM